MNYLDNEGEIQTPLTSMRQNFTPSFLKCVSKCDIKNEAEYTVNSEEKFSRDKMAHNIIQIASQFAQIAGLLGTHNTLKLMARMWAIYKVHNAILRREHDRRRKRDHESASNEC